MGEARRCVLSKQIASIFQRLTSTLLAILRNWTARNRHQATPGAA